MSTNFTQAELEALPEISLFDLREIKCECGRTINIPIARRMEAHDSEVIGFYMGGRMFEVVKSEGRWYRHAVS